MYSAIKLRPILSNDLIRLGRNEDGGYIVNKRIIDKTKALITFGISGDWSFESDFYKLKKGKPFKIEAYDFSVSVRDFFKTSFDEFKKIFKFKKSFLHILYSLYFIKVGLNFAAFFNKKNITFYKKGIDDHVSKLFVDFNTIMKKQDSEYRPNEIFIKMDIEGYEFKVLESVFEFSEKINAFVVEFHDLDVNGEKFERILKLAEVNGFIITHVHPNNYGGFIEGSRLPRLLEITLGKSSFFSPEEIKQPNTRTYPIPDLDFKCIRNIPELELHFDA